MRKTIAAASIAVTGLGVLGLGTAAIAGAQEDPSEDSSDEGHGGWVQDALGGLVDDGTITQEQADAVEEALEEARPEHGFGHRGPFLALGDPSTVAETLGIDEDELRSELADGKTIAEIAEEQGVDVQDVVDAIVAAQRERLDEAVADGDLTQEEADEILAGAEDRATAFVNGERPDTEDLPDLPGDPEMRHRWPGPWGHDDSSEEESENDSEDDSEDEAPASYRDEPFQLNA